MDCDELLVLIKKGETERIDFKKKAFLRNSNKVAEQLTAFANRHGGTILVGVEDTGEIEGVTFNQDKTQLTIINIAHDKCSPVVSCTMGFIISSKGEVLVITVEKREGMPHAIVRRSGQYIQRRTYYLRSGNSNRLVDDHLLNYLFSHVNDPTLSFNFDLHIYYSRINPRANPVPRHHVFRPLYEFIKYLYALSDEDVAYILADESSRLRQLYVELLPYVMLSYLSFTFSSSWLVNIERRAGHTTIKPIPIDHKEVLARDIILPSPTSLLAQLSVRFSEIFKKGFFKLALPPMTNVRVNIDKGRSTLSFEREKSFRFDFTFSGGSWSRGPGRLASAFGVLDNFDERYALGKEIASFSLPCTFSGVFAYPDIDESFDQFYTWGRTIIDFLQRDWDWSTFMDSMPDDILFSIENYCKRILEKLETEKAS